MSDFDFDSGEEATEHTRLLMSVMSEPDGQQWPAGFETGRERQEVDPEANGHIQAHESVETVKIVRFCVLVRWEQFSLVDNM